VFQGSRVPVQTLFEYLEAGDTIDDFLDGFPTVTREQVVAVWVTDDIEAELRYRQANEDIEFRYWDGTNARHRLTNKRLERTAEKRGRSTAGR
jgi:uncharacterized protein (DUF433 family)